MRGTQFAELAAFVAIAERGSFAKAAATLGVAPSTLSQTIRALEERLGIRVLNRTTRSIALTEAGERLLAQVRPALEALRAAAESVNALRRTPAGRLRLNVSSLAAAMLVGPILGEFGSRYPLITLDVVVDDGSVDIVSGRFDAGIRPGAGINRDMVAVRVSPPSRQLAVAAPGYLARRPRPREPRDLLEHNCLRFRLTTGETQRWEFHRAGQTFTPAVDGTFVTNDPDLVLQAAIEGAGIACLLEPQVRPLLSAGRLVPVLEDWAAPFPGYYIYYPGRRQLPAALRAFTDMMRRSGAMRGAQEPWSAGPGAAAAPIDPQENRP